jgi:hypothetical protein
MDMISLSIQTSLLVSSDIPMLVAHTSMKPGLRVRGLVPLERVLSGLLVKLTAENAPLSYV